MTGARRRQAGYSIIESLVVIALVGLLAMAVGTLVPSLGREVGGRMSDEDRFEQQLLATRRLRSDLERATEVRVEDRQLRIDAPEKTLLWRVEGGTLVREQLAGADGPGRSIVRRYRFRPDGVPFDAELGAEKMADGWLVRWRLGEAPQGWNGIAFVRSGR